VLFYVLFVCVVLCIVCVYMCTVLLLPGGYPIAVKYIISNILHEIGKRKANWNCHILGRNCLLQRVTEGKIHGGRSDKKTRKKT